MHRALPPRRRGASVKEEIAAALAETRGQTLSLLEPLTDEELTAQHSPLMSPLVWDLAHIGHFEELWLVREVGGLEPLEPGHDDLYDAFRHARAERGALSLPTPVQARRFLELVRGRTLEVLDRVDLDGDDPLLADAFVYGTVLQHEQQHIETMLATIQIAERIEYPLPSERTGGVAAEGELLVAGGRVVLGTDDDAWAYDNERPAHEVELAPFRIDLAPVTNGAFAEFVAAGGYEDPRLWSEEGWQRRVEAGLEHPQFWRRESDASWSRLRFGHLEPLPRDEPVQHVCWYEADAFARWAGKRLPTEVEWETAASWASDGKRRFPWGDEEPDTSRANLGRARFAPAAASTVGAGASERGALQLIGDVWEWTASDFTAWPGFRAFPYAEYSEVFFGPEYRVLRGGSWATSPLAIRSTFRNWDYPVRRQIFAGFRCAREA